MEELIVEKASFEVNSGAVDGCDVLPGVGRSGRDASSGCDGDGDEVVFDLQQWQEKRWFWGHPKFSYKGQEREGYTCCSNPSRPWLADGLTILPI